MRTDSTLGVIFFTRKKRNNPERLDIYVRITVNKERAEFSIKRDISVCNWDFLRCRAKETSENLILFNSYLDDVYAEVFNAHKQLHSERKLITARAIKLRYFGEDEERMTLMKAVEYHNQNINNELRPGTLKNYFSTEKYLKEFLRERLKTDDIYLIQLNYKFIVNFRKLYQDLYPQKRKKDMHQ